MPPVQERDRHYAILSNASAYRTFIFRSAVSPPGRPAVCLLTLPHPAGAAGRLRNAYPMRARQSVR